jgi:hypothetical protein
VHNFRSRLVIVEHLTLRPLESERDIGPMFVDRICMFIL